MFIPDSTFTSAARSDQEGYRLALRTIVGHPNDRTGISIICKALCSWKKYGGRTIPFGENISGHLWSNACAALLYRYKVSVLFCQTAFLFRLLSVPAT
jgi:hypothetical protein